MVLNDYTNAHAHTNIGIHFHTCVHIANLMHFSAIIPPFPLQLVVSLMDENDNAPRFTMLPGDMPVVPENALVGRIVAVVGASDADQGSNAQLTYSITGGSGQGTHRLIVSFVVSN